MKSSDYSKRVEELTTAVNSPYGSDNLDLETSIIKNRASVLETVDKAVAAFEQKNGKEPPMTYQVTVRNNTINNIVAGKAVENMNKDGKGISIAKFPALETAWDAAYKAAKSFAKKNEGQEPPKNYIDGVKRNVIKRIVAKDIITSMTRDGKEASIKKFPTAAKAWETEDKAIKGYEAKNGEEPSLAYTNAIRKAVVNRELSIKDTSKAKVKEVTKATPARSKEPVSLEF